MRPEFWESQRKLERSAEESRRKPEQQGGEMTHALLWKRTRHNWDELLTGNDYVAFRDSWRTFTTLCDLHRGCPTDVRCWACGHSYCEHLAGSVCTSYPVCENCDTYVQPNPYNPRCRWIVEYYASELEWGAGEGQEPANVAFGDLVAEISLMSAPAPAPGTALAPAPETTSPPGPPPGLGSGSAGPGGAGAGSLWAWDHHPPEPENETLLELDPEVTRANAGAIASGAFPAHWGWDRPQPPGERWPEPPEGSAWLPVRGPREREAETVAGVVWVAPLYLRLENGHEWILVVLAGQAPHVTEHFRRCHPFWPGNNILICSQEGRVIRYS